MYSFNVGILTGNHFPRLGGMEFVTHLLAERLTHIPDVNVSVACGTMPEVPSDFLYPYPCYRSKSFSYLTPWLFTRNQHKMIREQKVNILHGPMLHDGGYMAMQWSDKLGVPFVAQSHGADVQMVPEIGYGSLLDPAEKRKILKVVGKAACVVAVSKIIKGYIVELGVDPSRIAVIHNGIQFREIHEIPHEDYRKKWQLADDDFVLITVGRNRPVKRIELLFEGLRKLRDYDKIKCLCVGPQENLAALAKKYGIAKSIILTGRIPDVNTFSVNPPFPRLINAYRAANLYVSTSYVESFGSAATDALACGIPIIVGRKHGVREIIKEGYSGWVMEKETPEELAEMILSIYNNRNQLRDNRFEISKSVEWLTWDYVAKEMVEVYKNILS